MPGQNQIGEYKLIELAGEGSFGKASGCSSTFVHAHCCSHGLLLVMRLSYAVWLQVWIARRTGSLQTVAVKLITKHGKNEKDLRNLRQVQQLRARPPSRAPSVHLPTDGRCSTRKLASLLQQRWFARRSTPTAAAAAAAGLRAHLAAGLRAHLACCCSLPQEIEILRKLQHPNIIAMLDAFETKNDFCVVTEFAQGA